MSADIAMGGLTNTILHTLAAAQEANRLHHARYRRVVSTRAPPGETCLNSDRFHIEDFHRAGGFQRFGELYRANCCRTPSIPCTFRT